MRRRSTILTHIFSTTTNAALCDDVIADVTDDDSGSLFALERYLTQNTQLMLINFKDKLTSKT